MSERRIGEGQIPRLGAALEHKSDPERRLGPREYGVLVDVVDIHTMIQGVRDTAVPDDDKAGVIAVCSQKPWWRLYCDLRFCLAERALIWATGALPYYITEIGVLVPITDCRYSRGLVEFVVTLDEEPFLASGSTKVLVTDQPDVGWRLIDDIIGESERQCPNMEN